MSRVPFRFGVNDHVIIKELKWPARVRSVRIDFDGVLYQVTYWWEGTLRDCWLSADELKEPA